MEEVIEEKRGFNVLSSFWLKVIAIVAMTLDHIGIFLDLYSVANSTLILIFRIIGRLALPLYCFMIAEGVMHTKSFPKYILKLGIIAVIVSVAEMIMLYGFDIEYIDGNIFIDLILGAVAVKCLMNKNNYIKLLAILPVAVGVVSYVWYGFSNAGWIIADYYPSFLRPQYAFIGILMIMGFYAAHLISKGIFELQGLEYENIKGSRMDRIVINAVSCGVIIVVFSLYYLLCVILLSNGQDMYVFWDYSLYTYAMLACIPIIFYSGKLGYHKKWFQYSTYFYYPVHIAVIFLIFVLIFG